MIVQETRQKVRFVNNLLFQKLPVIFLVEMSLARYFRIRGLVGKNLALSSGYVHSSILARSR